MLVSSQVLLSIVLPTVIFPLVYLCSREEVMTVDGPEVETSSNSALPALQSRRSTEAPDGNEEAQLSPRRKKIYISPKWVTILGYALFGVVVLANGYVIVELALGNA